MSIDLNRKLLAMKAGYDVVIELNTDTPEEAYKSYESLVKIQKELYDLSAKTQRRCRHKTRFTKR
jgi:hypothetical protein